MHHESRFISISGPSLRTFGKQFPTVLMGLVVLAFSAYSAGAQSSGGNQVVEPWQIVEQPQATLVLDSKGALLGSFGTEKRFSIPLESLPEYVANAFIAVEDKRFYQHDGVDLVGVAAAIKDAVLSGEVRGASTITQLLVGNMHPEIIDRRDRTAGRKLREQQAARDMEKRYSKHEILEAFLNQISFGRGTYGIEMAARYWFGKSASDLTLAEAASLAAMPRSPVQYDPVRYPDRNRTRRNLVLSLMRDQGYISAAEARAAQQETLLTSPDILNGAGAWVTDIVRIQANRAGVEVGKGGYKIVTTVDAELQSLAAKSLTNAIGELESSSSWRHSRCSASNTVAGRECLEGSVVVLDPFSGDVKAIAGGRDYALSSFNRAVDGRRQPGSSFKPFVYAAALMSGSTAATEVSDTALSLALPEGGVYSPQNSDGLFMGEMSMREAISMSRNTVAVDLARKTGISVVADLAQKAGLSTRIAPFPSSALGASEVQPLDFVAAWSVFANGGYSVEPRFIQKIEKADGGVVYEAPVQARNRVLDPRVAFIVRDMLEDAVEMGTGRRARSIVPSSIPIAGKTGTSNSNTDVWFVGMRPDLVVGAWLGFDRPRPISDGAAGGTIAAPIVANILGAWPYSARWSEYWLPPPGLVALDFSRLSGRIADSTTESSDRYREWFLAGTEPGARNNWPWNLFRSGPLGH